MVLKKFIQKSKTFLNQTHHKLKSFLIIGNKKLPKSLSLNPLSNNNVYADTPQSNQHYRKQLNELSETDKKITPTEEESTNNSISITSKEMVKIKEVKGEKPNMLLQKMKELEMMDLNDVNQMMDIEEVMFYYSRLKSQVYIDIVDKFFMDMYTEFLVPKPSVSASSSLRRLGPLKL